MQIKYIGPISDLRIGRKEFSKPITFKPGVAKTVTEEDGNLLLKMSSKVFVEVKKKKKKKKTNSS